VVVVVAAVVRVNAHVVALVVMALRLVEVGMLWDSLIRSLERMILWWEMACLDVLEPSKWLGM
jgi:hypothetical protein